ncbi:response regulator [Solirubrobacter phytolaccae]|uniref:Response regulator n=1 Tax=Solirubrobacter phytolaccae TaxID=1404360 RepID=A0A9X3S7P6_9ACTN|nr:response regulator [Solirubrobacter phytolaccae]MDA0180558.1 response regulator [Solirubrobacter phytolaccae]
MRVLVVEDNERNAKLARDVLSFAGFDVVVASSGEACLEVVGGVDVVLMDINLPGMSGVEALAALREVGVTVPVAAFTAHAMHDDRDRLLAAGFDGYIEKPVDVRALPGQVEALLRS